MTREEKISEVNSIRHHYPPEKNTRLSRLWNKRCQLSDKKLNNLLKQFRVHKLFYLAK